MKYIRMKDGKILESYYYKKDSKGWYFNNFTDYYVFHENDIVSQADTIDELCDVLIIKTKDYRGFKGELKTVDLRKDDFKTGVDLHDYIFSQMNHNGLFEFAFLGIETDKGLIYVSKMNDEGKLELL